ncbi:carboxypeptidase-like regulatory domain-containing protein [Deinococcus pimensis]|uniref:carboxypeptidase-like regulatory domain-containing protein n=1 Tax=Deinococcus pimensis TaxID=309888 RepID=UPI000485C4E9|nr:carboxypeptidase-like regulatory domain-containing protein [Deinococcus pimensis]
MKKSIAALLLLTTLLSACTEVGEPTPVGGNNPPPVDTNPGDTTGRAGFITGTVVNEQGTPLAGVEVVADNTLSYDSNLITTTDAQGRYSIDVRGAPVTFNMFATLRIRYESYSVGVDLVPENPETVAGGVGGVRNFTFKPKPVSEADPYGNLACVFLEHVPGEYDVDFSKVTVKLKSVGTLADGTSNVTRDLKFVQSGSGWVAANVMWGTYEVTATMNGQPLELRRRVEGYNDNPWGATYTGGFTKNYYAVRPNMYLEVRTPRSQ